LRCEVDDTSARKAPQTQTKLHPAWGGFLIHVLSYVVLEECTEGILYCMKYFNINIISISLPSCSTSRRSSVWGPRFRPDRRYAACPCATCASVKLKLKPRPVRTVLHLYASALNFSLWPCGGRGRRGREIAEATWSWNDASPGRSSCTHPSPCFDGPGRGGREGMDVRR
jgi:hypothetical protein